jgi:hypothetical protein
VINLSIEELSQKYLCDGDLYLKFPQGHRVHLLKPGLYIDENFKNKYASINAQFELGPVTSAEMVEEYRKLFYELCQEQLEKPLRKKTQEIICLFLKYSSNNSHFLNFAKACFDEFCVLKKNDLERMNETDVLLFKKSLYSAAFSVIIGLSNDYFSYNMLKDFYNVSLALDIGLCNPDYSYFVAQAVNYENRFPGKGGQWLLDNKATKKEIDIFLHHPMKSYEFFQENRNLLNFVELMEIILYQHELNDGRGFPRGVWKAQVSSWEAIVLLASSLVDIAEEYEFETNVIPFILNYRSAKLNDLPVNRVYQKLCMIINEILKDKGLAS